MRKNEVEALALDALDLVRNGLLVNLRFMSAALPDSRPCPSPALRSPPMARICGSIPSPGRALTPPTRPKLLAPTCTRCFTTCFCTLTPDWHRSPSMGHRLRHGGGIGDRPARSSRHAHGPSGGLASPSWSAWPKKPASLDRRARLCRPARPPRRRRNRRTRPPRHPFPVDDHRPWHAVVIAEGKRRARRARHRRRGPRAPLPPRRHLRHRHGHPPMGPPTFPIPQRPIAMDAADIAEGRARERRPGHRRALRHFRAARPLSRAGGKTRRWRWASAGRLRAKLWGIEGSNLAMNLRKVTRESDYRAFLRKFARMGEADPRERRRVRLRVLYLRLEAVRQPATRGTSGIRRGRNASATSSSPSTPRPPPKTAWCASLSGVPIPSWLTRRAFFSRMNVLIVQCDAAITDVARITCLRDLGDYPGKPHHQGLGGTDFRPVFTSWTRRSRLAR